jgi:Fic family protein
MDLNRPTFTMWDAMRPEQSAERVSAVIRTVLPHVEELRQLTREYRPWRKFKLVATEAGLPPEDAWAFVKHTCVTQARFLDYLQQADGRPFVLVEVPHLQEALHRIDRGLGGGGPAVLDDDQGALGGEDQRKRLRIKSLMDEAAESSLIEGASGTRKQATSLLRSGREPKSKGERMIVNNYVAMQRIKEWLGQPLSVEMLLELQTILTEGTLEDPGEAGRLREPGEPVHVIDERDGSTIYTPPGAAGLRVRLRQVCLFANQSHQGGDFLHPIIKASILHFLIGYEHPFCDGNGRTARAVFYWYALRHGYSIFEFMPISDRIRAGFARYPQAYLDTENEGGDLTHFVLYKLNIIQQSLDRLVEHLDKEQAKVVRAQSIVRASASLNLRQKLIIEHALRSPTTVYTVKSHQRSNGITDPTARADLEGLVKARFFFKTMRGKEAQYHPQPDLHARVFKKKAR